MIIERLIYRGEAFVKGILFDCQSCGQCVLKKNGLICPMSCPKGLRNGPCGGTLGERCEVDSRRKCVHCRIHKRVSGKSMDRPFFLRPPDRNLEKTSSYINLFTGRDRISRIEAEPLAKWAIPVEKRNSSDSRLKIKLQSENRAITCEIRSPRNPGDKRFLKEADLLGELVDAFNVTAFLNGKPSIPSTDTAICLKKEGFEPIVQTTCRDYTRTTFVSELLRCSEEGISNILCLTGDHYKGVPGIRQVFDYDSSTMLYEAAYLDEKKEIFFTGAPAPDAGPFFLGAAINPLTEPVNIPIRRIGQKAFSGTDFIQSQLIFDSCRLKDFMTFYCKEGLQRRMHFMAGIPLVISGSALKMIPSIPGVSVSTELLRRLEDSNDIRKEGLRLAEEIIDDLWDVKGIRGFHLMLFGKGTDEIKALAEYIRKKDK